MLSLDFAKAEYFLQNILFGAIAFGESVRYIGLLLNLKNKIMSYCQDTRPTIFIDEDLADRRISKFVRLKHGILTEAISKIEGINKTETTCITYTERQFSKLLDNLKNTAGVSGFRVYFASYIFLEDDPDNENDYIPFGHNNLLTLIFAPTKSVEISGQIKHRDIGSYYIIDPSDPRKMPTDIKTTSIKKRWVDHYLIKKLKKIEEKYGIEETKSMWYTKDEIYELIAEIKCWQDKPNPVKKVNIFFSCYLQNEMREEQGMTYDLSKKLTIVFNFETEKELSESEQKRINDFFVPLKKFKDYDTGSPCPPLTCP